MEYILFGVILLQFGYIVYSDIQNRKEREVMTLKIMSKDIDEYKTALEDTPEDSPKKEEDEYIPVDDVGAERIIKAKEL